MHAHEISPDLCRPLREGASADAFMRGGCFMLALWLHHKTGLPLYGLYDAQDRMHHAFVYDPASETAYDARGAHRGLDRIRYYQGRSSAGELARPATVEDVQGHAALAEEEARIWGRALPSRRAITGFVRSVPALAQLVTPGNTIV